VVRLLLLEGLGRSSEERPVGWDAGGERMKFLADEAIILE